MVREAYFGKKKDSDLTSKKYAIGLGHPNILPLENMVFLVKIWYLNLNGFLGT
jgi:hypothetical protein